MTQPQAQQQIPPSPIPPRHEENSISELTYQFPEPNFDVHQNTKSTQH